LPSNEKDATAMRFGRFWLFLLATSIVAPVLAEDGAKPATIDFNRDIRPILSARCLNCHGIDEESRKGELRLDQRADAVRNRDGFHVIKPGEPDESELIARVDSTEAEEIMPPPKSGPPLKPEERELLKRWVSEGANYAEHWAFGPVVNQQPPATSNDSWATSPIDRFILSRLDKAGLKPAKPADKATLIRRLSLDLTGLPPTPAEVDAFVRDDSPSAYQAAVRRLLDSPHYGERMARVWLDLARYADSKGYGSDPLREYMWRYRDWVIDAFNRNLPYDQFVTQQLAGDLIPGATNEQLLATAFHRNTLTNDEGGTDDEEFRVEAIKDRVDTTGQVFMGLTVGCAKCHTHKFDPISHKDYYALFAVFNQTEDNDNPSDEPRVPTPTPDQSLKIQELQARIAALSSVPIPRGKQFDEALIEWTARVRGNTDWLELRPKSLASTASRSLQVDETGAIVATGDADKATDTLTFQIPKGVTALRLEAVANEVEIKGPGQTPHGNFVLSSLSASLDTGIKGVDQVRFVRIELPGNDKILSLAEVQVFRDSENVASKGEASQSTTDFEGPAKLAVDGNTDGKFAESKSVTHTAISKDPWWELDLKGTAGRVDKVTVWNRTDPGVESRLAGAVIKLMNANRKVLSTTALTETPKQSREIAFGGPSPVTFASATSSHDQPDFEISRLLKKDRKGMNDGWAIGGMPGRTQDAVFLASSPAPAGQLTIELSQNYGGRHTIGKYRIYVSTEKDPPTALPIAIRDLAVGCDCCRVPADQAKLEEYYWRNIAPEMKSKTTERKKVEAELESLHGKIVRTPVMKELPADKRRATHILEKGNYKQLGAAVTADLPHSFHKLANPSGGPASRLDLARWITDRNNPLTARVAVNRVWAMIYGRGLVETEEDFGTQGRSPSHPELLDFLAAEFMADGWDIKRLVVRIVDSSTYRQSSMPDDRERLRAVDPRNELLSHYPRTRLEAETIRDQALAISGLFSPQVGGPSVYPPQPPNIWQAAFNGQRTWPTSTGADKYRRGLYTFWRRTTPYPSMMAFDAPSREFCSVRRIGSNTPLQAYVTLNDPVFVEAAQALARRMIAEGGKDADSRIAYGYKLATARELSPERLVVFRKLFDEELSRYRSDEAAAKALAEKPLGPLPAGIAADEAAAMTVISNVLLNLDSVLTKG
jgi:hypothetical protein